MHSNVVTKILEYRKRFVVGVEFLLFGVVDKEVDEIFDHLCLKHKLRNLLFAENKDT